MAISTFRRLMKDKRRRWRFQYKYLQFLREEFELCSNRREEQEIALEIDYQMSLLSHGFTRAQLRLPDHSRKLKKKPKKKN